MAGTPDVQVLNSFLELVAHHEAYSSTTATWIANSYLYVELAKGNEAKVTRIVERWFCRVRSMGGPPGLSTTGAPQKSLFDLWHVIIPCNIIFGADLGNEAAVRSDVLLYCPPVQPPPTGTPSQVLSNLHYAEALGCTGLGHENPPPAVP